jgi:hypothetical protein
MASTPHRPAIRRLAIALLMASGLVLLVCGLLVPAHFRALDAQVVAEAGRGTPSQVDHGIAHY